MRLSESSNARCLLLHVVDNAIPLRLAGRRAARALDELRWHARRHSKPGTLPEISALIGAHANTIARVAADWDADLIVLGAAHHHALNPFAWSTAERVAHRTGRAVLAVARPVPTDDPGYGKVTFIAPRVDLDVCIGVAERHGLLDSARVAVIAPRSLYDPVRCWFGERSRRRRSECPAKPLSSVPPRAGGTFEMLEARPSIGEVLDKLEHSTRAQLLVTGIERSSWLLGGYSRSLTVRAMRKSLCDVLLIPGAHARAPSASWTPALQRGS